MKPRNNNYDNNWSDNELEELQELEDTEMEKSLDLGLDDDTWKEIDYLNEADDLEGVL